MPPTCSRKHTNRRQFCYESVTRGENRGLVIGSWELWMRTNYRLPVTNSESLREPRSFRGYRLPLQFGGGWNGAYQGFFFSGSLLGSGGTSWAGMLFKPLNLSLSF